MRVLVVGAGLSGCVAAREFASAGHSVTVIEKREHVAGHAYDYLDERGVMVHKYGPHLFHTNDDQVIEYLSRFTNWLPHEHRMLSSIGGKLVPVPINLVTMREFYGYDFTPEAMRDHLKSVSIRNGAIKTSEDWLLATYGRELTDLFFREYIRKQWGRELSELDASVASRIQPRFSDDCRTFLDKFQAIPEGGYTCLCEAMLVHLEIRVALGKQYRGDKQSRLYDLTVFTGPVDEFFGHCFGKLPYRSLSFVHEASELPLPAPTVVYPRRMVSMTRMTDWRQIAGAHRPAKDGMTSLLREYPTDDPDAEPMYPVPSAESAALYAKYEELAAARKDVLFVGRLGRYVYRNMDQIVGDTLSRVRALL